ncbi:MAG: hypothetical protein K8L99_15600 [Anaerolineae bacterium]|jgi:hypothetical protein|nr:hypothetical protein [Anaerolineae bacterium]
MNAHIIAISSYGSNRVKHPHTDHTVSAYKLGYTSAASAVLLALYRDQAQDVSSKHASYHYVQIHAEVTVRHGYILLKVNDDELTRAEAITLQNHRPAVYRWLAGAWQEFPSIRSAQYQAITSHSGPNFNPTGMRIVSASTGEAEAAIAGITVEKSERSDNDTPWWWLRGDTYPHRDLLKRWGCRWSKRQKAWYYIGKTLPDAVQALIDAPSYDAPCSDEEATAILGVDIQPKPQPETPRLFALGETVYARHDLVSPAGKPIPTGTCGKITRLYNRNASHGWSYDVDFEDIGTGWFFERELTSLEPVQRIRITRGAVVPPGAVLPPTDAEIKQTLVEGGHQPEAHEPDNTPEEAEVPKIRIIKPVLDISDEVELDAVATAIRQTKAETLHVLQASSASNGRRSLVCIPQVPCGELTGSITGSVWCYGYTVHEGICVYLNLGGPRMAVEAIRAKLAKGDQVSCVPWDAPSVELTAGEGNTGMYTAFTQNIPEAKFTSLILLHEQVIQPNYGGKATTFILHVSDEQAMAQLRHHVTKLVKVPVFPDWTGYLWQAGQSAMLVRKTRGAGGLDVLAIDLDVDSWTRLLTGGLSQDIIHLPQNA